MRRSGKTKEKKQSEWEIPEINDGAWISRVLSRDFSRFVFDFPRDVLFIIHSNSIRPSQV